MRLNRCLKRFACPPPLPSTDIFDNEIECRSIDIIYCLKLQVMCEYRFLFLREGWGSGGYLQRGG